MQGVADPDRRKWVRHRGPVVAVDPSIVGSGGERLVRSGNDGVEFRFVG